MVGAALALVTAAPAATAGPAVPPPGEPGATPRIIGGQPATNAPWAARLFVNGRRNCSATIIAPRYILTARHCVSNTGAGYSFRIGSLDQTSGGTVANAVAITRSQQADLAIAQLDRDVSATYAPLGSTGDIDGITAGGDSGGPMFADGRQVGVASTSDRATRRAYTNITSYRSWIRSIAGV